MTAKAMATTDRQAKIPSKKIPTILLGIHAINQQGRKRIIGLLD
jgi:hypothetical protein